MNPSKIKGEGLPPPLKNTMLGAKGLKIALCILGLAFVGGGIALTLQGRGIMPLTFFIPGVSVSGVGGILEIAVFASICRRKKKASPVVNTVPNSKPVEVTSPVQQPVQTKKELMLEKVRSLSGELLVEYLNNLSEKEVLEELLPEVLKEWSIIEAIGKSRNRSALYGNVFLQSFATNQPSTLSQELIFDLFQQMSFSVGETFLNTFENAAARRLFMRSFLSAMKEKGVAPSKNALDAFCTHPDLLPKIELQHCTERQFVQRHLYPYTKDTGFEGSHQIDSVLYWLELLEASSSPEKSIFSPDLKPAHVQRLLKHLQRAKEDLHTNLTKSNCDVHARNLLTKIKEALESEPNQPYYIPLGYAAGALSQGHGNFLKVNTKDSKTLELRFLDTGAGASYHPIVEWEATTPRIDYHMFPLTIDKETFFGPKGQDLFARLITLRTFSPSPKDTRYSERDLYEGFKSLGTFSAPISMDYQKRASKPQKGDNCADRAVSLLIRDIVNDCDCDKKTRSRLFAFERLTSLIAYYHRLKALPVSLSSDWAILESALQEFAIRFLKTNKSLSENEKQRVEEITDLLSLQVTFILNHMERSPLQDNCKNISLDAPVPYVFTIKEERFRFRNRIASIKQDNDLPPLPFPCPTMQQIVTALQQADLATEKTVNKNSGRTCLWIYRALLTLPIPTPSHSNGWEKLSKEERRSVLNSLVHLVHRVSQAPMQEYFHIQVLSISIAYCIAFELARLNPDCRLQGFYPYFHHTIEKLKRGYSKEVSRLCIGEANRAWKEVVEYFSELAIKGFNKRQKVAFGYHSNNSLTEAVENLKKEKRARGLDDTSIHFSEHLSYLIQFLDEKNEFYQGEAAFVTLFEQQTPQLPQEVHHLHYLSHLSSTWLDQDWKKQSVSPGQFAFIIERASNEIMINTPSDKNSKKCMSHLGSPYNPLKRWLINKKFLKDENVAICEAFHRDIDSRIIHCERNIHNWQRIYATPSLSIPSILLWMRLHIAEIKNKRIQDVIEIGIFNPGKLIDLLKANPQAIDLLRKTVKKGIAFFQTSLDPLLFFIRMGISIESFVEKPSREALQSYEELLLKLSHQKDSKLNAYLLLCYLYRFDLPREGQSCIDMLKARHWLYLFGQKREQENEDLYDSFLEVPLWVDAEGHAVYDQWIERIFAYSQDEKWLFSLGNSLCQEYELPLPINSVIEKTSETAFRLGPYHFDMGSNTIEKEGKFLSLIPGRKKTSDVKEALVWIGLGSSEKQEGLTHDAITGIVSEWKSFGGELYQHVTLKDEVSFAKGCSVWQNASGHFLFCDPTSLKPLFKATTDEKSLLHIEKLDENGMPFLRLVEPPHFECKRLGMAPDELIYLFNSRLNRIEEIHYTSLGLDFKTRSQEDHRLFCTQYSGFCLDESAHLPELGSFKGAIVLKNGSKQHLLIPAQKLEAHLEKLERKTLLGGKKICKDKAFFSYSLEQGRLVSLDPEANCFLVVLFATQGNYEKALSYLPYAKDFTKPGSYKFFIEAIMELKDRKPQALAFYLRITKFWIDHSRQLIYHHQQKRADTILDEKEKEKEEIYLWVASHYEYYLRWLSSKTYSRIPSSLRLSYEEEKELLCTLKPSFELIDWHKDQEKSVLESVVSMVVSDSSRVWSPLFQMRFELLTRGASRQTIVPVGYPLTHGKGVQTLQHSTMLDKWNSSPPTLAFPFPEVGDFVRISEDEIPTYFVNLYQRAFNSDKAARDHFFLESSCEGEDRKLILLSYFFLLSNVYQNQEAFKDLVFSEDEETNKGIFKEICARALKNSKSWSATLKKGVNFLADQKICNLWYFNTSDLQLPRSLSLSSLKWEFSPVEKEALLKEWNKPALEKQQIQHEINVLEDEISFLQHRAETIANFTRKQDVRLQQIGCDLPQITMCGILTQTYQKQDPMLLKKANPSLTDAEVKKCISLTIRFHLLRVQKIRFEQALIALDQGDREQGNAFLEMSKEFDPTEESEVFIHQSLNRKCLRREQERFLKWHFENTNSKQTIAAFSAGGGKTSILGPILSARLQRLGRFPVSLSPPSLNTVDREGLRRNLQETFSIDLSAFSFLLETPLKTIFYRRYLKELMRYSQQHVLKITPQDFYALHLHYSLALDVGDVEAVNYLSCILALFREKGALLGDEARVNFSPFTQAKVGIGIPHQLPKADQKVFLAIYRAFVDADDQLKLLTNQHVGVDETVLKNAKLKAFNKLLDDPLFGIKENEKQDVLQFWQNGLPLAQSFHTHRALREIKAVKIYFQIFYSQAMQLVGKMQHRRSSKKEEDIHTPARKRQPTGAYFEEPFMALIATIHGLLQEKMTLNQVERLLMHLKEQHVKEVGSTMLSSSYELLFQKWMQDSHLRLGSFEAPKSMHQKMHTNSDAIFWFLENIALDQVTFSPEQIVVTPMHLKRGMRHLSLYSANPGPPEIYGLYGAKCFEDKDFFERISKALKEEKNSAILQFDNHGSPFEYFKQMKQKDTTCFEKLRMIIDVGGMWRDFPNEQIVDDFLKFNQEHHLGFEGVLYFEEAQHDSEGNLLLRLHGKTHILYGNDVASALAAMGIKYDDYKLMVLIDPPHTTGANIDIIPKGKNALMLMGEQVSKGDAIQGAMRLRGLLRAFLNQSITWGVQSSLAKKINPHSSEALSVQSIIAWAEKNEEEREKKEILMSGFQQIALLIQEQATQELEGALNHPERQIDIWAKYRKGFVSQVDFDLISRFDEPEYQEKPRTLLLEFAQRLYTKFGYGTSWKNAHALKAKMEPVIQTVERYHTTITSRASKCLNQETHIQQFATTHTQKEQIQVSRSDLRPVQPDPLPSSLKITQENFVTSMLKKCTSAQALYGSKHLSSHLYFTPNSLSTAASGWSELKEDYLKPVQYLLAVYEKEKWIIFALADCDAAFFQEQMINLKNSFIKIALLNADGWSLVRYNCTEEELETEAIQDACIDVGLTQCTLFFPNRFKERISSWSDFEPMWEKMKKGYWWPQERHTDIIEKFLDKKKTRK